MSTLVLSDTEIDRLLTVPKRVLNPSIKMKMQGGSELQNFDVSSQDGDEFRLYVRQNTRIADGYSCGLLYVAPSGDTMTLVRYNGSDHVHTNPLEGGAPISFKCHIHRATSRYIAAGRKPEHFAEATTRYSDLKGALLALVTDCKITGLEDQTLPPQMKLL